MTSQDAQLTHGQPQISRNDTKGFDRYEWLNGLLLFIYDDGRVKLGHWDSTVTVTDVSNFAKGKSRGSAHVIARFKRTKDVD
jgi:hypothetical protein